MNKSAIMHIPLSQYAYAVDAHTLVIRLRAARGDLKQCDLYYGDRVDPVQPIRVKRLPMTRTASDDLFDYYEARVRDDYSRVCYYFDLSDGTESCFYYERGLCGELTCERTEYFQFPYIRREDIPDIPAWAADAMMYHIFPDSFAAGRRKITGSGREVALEGNIRVSTGRGGTLAGIRANLDYIGEMGFNCIYLNPVFMANSYHKYDTIDYFAVDPLLGTKEELRDLVKECHERGIRVILDGVFNHCGSDFFAFRDVREKGKDSRYFDWFYSLPEQIRFEDPPNYEAFAYVKEMPKLNTGNTEVAEYLCNVGTYWIRELDIDGWRLDVANEVDHDFWRRFRHAVRAEKPDVFLIGEIWENAAVWLMGDQFDSTMNYAFSYLCRDFFGRECMTVSEFDAGILRMQLRYPHTVSAVQMNFLDSHDVSRFLSACSGRRENLRLAFFYLFMSVGIPSVFYGDEVYLEGETEPEYRQPMRWQGDNFREEIRQWITLRKEHPALRRGSMRTVLVQDDTGVYGFVREDGSETILVLLNNGGEEIEADLQKAGVAEYRQLYGAEGSMLSAKCGKVYQIVDFL